MAASPQKLLPCWPKISSPLNKTVSYQISSLTAMLLTFKKSAAGEGFFWAMADASNLARRYFAVVLTVSFNLPPFGMEPLHLLIPPHRINF